ncbi:calcium-binding protein [Silicimonas sp. MF1-12-2]|uniref:calcium-binding protein n=1 Tax=Silicimonas sp. MF1-12-2 TaxID=3384793 RepID=UPI0039B5C564
MPPFNNPNFSFPETFNQDSDVPPGQIISEAAKNSPVDLSNLPNQLVVVEDAPSALDLSSVEWKAKAQGNKNIVVEFAASAGTFEALSTDKVQVIGNGSGAIQLIGKLPHIKNFLENTQAILYTGAANDFGKRDLNINVIEDQVSSTVTSTTILIEEAPDEQIGTPQDDVLTGDDGRDILIGLGSNDLLIGNAGDDTIQGDDGKDTIIGGAGADSLDGGADEDVIQYLGSNAGVQIDLNLGANGTQQASGGHAEGDTIVNFEHVYGSDFADTITGDDGRNILFGYDGDDIINGGGGDDVIRGGEGADTMDGGEGIDWLRYVESVEGVTVDLSVSEQVSGGDADGDVISGFENVQGSDHGDIITGDDAANYLIGFGGDDMISGGAGRDSIRGGEGADTLDGGADVDTLQYTDSADGIVIDLNADASGFQSASGGDAEGDVISGFENVLGTNSNDIITGDAGRNILNGYAGDDILNGGDAKDALLGGAGADQFVFDTALAASNVDRILDFEAGIDMLMLAGEIFTGLVQGALSASAFHVAAGGIADTADQRIIYDTGNGNLYFDEDGNGTGEAMLFASLTSTPDLEATDIFIF